MSFVSSFLLEDLSKKLELEVLPELKKKNAYANYLYKKSITFDELPTVNDNCIINVTEKNFSSQEFGEDFSIVYIISVSFSKTNTLIHVSDSQGNTKNFYSSGSVGLIGKQKRRRGVAISRLIDLLITKISYTGIKPVAVHLVNVYSYKRLVIQKLKKKFFIKVVKVFNKFPFNGCRKKKIRRKKSSKKVVK